MTQLTNQEFKLETANLFPTNGVGAISAQDLRSQMDNMPDSVPFKTTGVAFAPTASDDDSDSGGNGAFEVGDIWLDETNDNIYICIDNTTSNAIWEIVNNVRASVFSVSSSRDIALTDENAILEIDTTAGAIVLTIPTNASIAFEIGTKIHITLLNTTNTATLTAAGGVDLNGITAGSGTLTATAFSSITLYKRNTNAWVVQGDIGAIA